VFKKHISTCVVFFYLIVYVAYVCAGTIAQPFPTRKDPWINDFANLINPQDTSTIEALCKQIYEQELASIVICTIESIPKTKKEYENITLYGSDLSNHWDIGRKDVDDGLLILISRKDRKAAICTGYLTEYFLPDAEAGRILRTFMFPKFKNGQYGEGIIAGITEARKVMLKNRRLMYPEKYEK
jgi:uncharacterized protein